ncbi:MAG: hypothetical protein AB1434_10720 [Pseudomonadota bacterium]
MLEKIVDPYERKARLAPALLALVPPAAVVFLLYGIEWQPKSAFAGFLVSAGIFYLLASIARELGKRLEDKLFVRWGGKPTTQLLRHRDHVLDPLTKRRYHGFLSARIGSDFPSAEDERKDGDAADHVYAAATRWLLEKTRDKQRFPLLFAENVAYGFRRNCLGLKPFALVIALAAASWVIASSGVVDGATVRWDLLHSMPLNAWSSLAISLIACAVWSLFVTPRTARTAAFAYADMLLRSCDALAEQE